MCAVPGARGRDVIVGQVLEVVASVYPRQTNGPNLESEAGPFVVLGAGRVCGAERMSASPTLARRTAEREAARASIRTSGYAVAVTLTPWRWSEAQDSEGVGVPEALKTLGTYSTVVPSRSMTYSCSKSPTMSTD